LLELSKEGLTSTQQKTGEFKAGSFIQTLEELYTMIEYTNDHLTNCIFNTNHASNYLSLKGQLGEQKQQFLKAISGAIEHAQRNGQNEPLSR
jgi:hypothetical protein